jgi:ParB-like chromosome segregation protein Spo0J
MTADWINEERDPRELLRHPRNPRTHSPEQVAELMVQMREFGFTNPILLAHDDDRIIAGHARTEAAMNLGLERVPVRKRNPAKPLTEAQELTLIIADNKIGEHAGWDDELLAGIFVDLRSAKYDLRLTGFALPDVSQIVASYAGGGADKVRERIVPPSGFFVLVTCDDEPAQAALFDELQARGLTCKLMN